MAANIKHELLAYLTAAEAIEQDSLALMRAGFERAGDEQIASIYRAHFRETEEHSRLLAERMVACGAPFCSGDALAPVAAVVTVSVPAPASAATLTAAACAHENLEIATYHVLRGVAQRAEDLATIAVVETILEQEETAAEVIASTIDRALEVSLGETPSSPTGHFGTSPDEGSR